MRNLAGDRKGERGRDDTTDNNVEEYQRNDSSVPNVSFMDWICQTRLNWKLQFHLMMDIIN